MPTSTTPIFTPQALSDLPEHWESLGHVFVHHAKTHPNEIALEDSTGLSLTYHDALLSSIALANILHDKLTHEEYIGVLLPPSVGAALVNIAITLLGKVPVNLNYTSSQCTFNSCITQCQIKHIISSRRVMQRVLLDSTASFLQIEMLRDEASLLVKAWAWSETDLMPENIMGHFLSGLKTSEASLDRTAALLFTAGSTGEPKGVVLSHRNILTNIHAIQQQARLSKRETVLGVVPFFHSFGFTLTLWAVLALGHRVVYHYDPRDAKKIGELCQKHNATVLFCTPTIMRFYLKRGHAEQFKTIRTCILGGEKLKPSLRQDIQHDLGITPLEGYGLTETSPVVACNIPGDIRLPDGNEIKGNKPGTVGMPLPGTKIRIVSLVTREDLPNNVEGMILVSGPQVMRGYLNKPEETNLVLTDNWFTTGDLGFLDDDGFLTISGRLSQFSKIGGEMVPHLNVEREILRVIGGNEQTISVTSVPDDRRGERLVVLHTKLNVTPAELVSQLKNEKGLSRLWIPDAKDFVEVSELPVLSTGKLDLREIKNIAMLHTVSE